MLCAFVFPRDALSFSQSTTFPTHWLSEIDVAQRAIVREEEVEVQQFFPNLATLFEPSNR
ncbi:hypothetical protein KIN20_027818 [Parelaphostrongylus tenuis]|uniref:Uncharacterized protein n=1 Tax=Parelaphostrongylus tenuis TaxID=148309 RepID=A0AAD5R014_PARTN|nr:hypothetical protein KIN20_027818 [Parelaphostrongylus tenuis]